MPQSLNTNLRRASEAAFAPERRGSCHAPEAGAYGQNASYAYAKRGGEVFCAIGQSCKRSENPVSENGRQKEGIMLAKLQMPYMGKTLIVFPELFCAPDWAMHRVCLTGYKLDDQRFGFAYVLSVAMAREDLLSRAIGLSVFHLN